MKKLLALIGYSSQLEEKKRVIYLIAAFGTTQLLMFLTFYILVTPNKWLVIETIIILIAYFSVFPLLKFGHYTLGKIIVIMGITIQVIMLVFVWFSKDTYLVLFFFIVPPIAFFVLDFSEEVEKRVLMAISIFICLVVLVFAVVEPMELIILEKTYINILRFMSVISTMISEILVFYFYVNSLHKTNRELMFLANTDALTNVSNRRRLFETGEELFKLYKKHHQDFTLMILDIDHFKRVNDNYGHPVGDEVLVGMSDLIEGSIRKEDLLCRYGGEEFAILFRNLPGKNREIIEAIKDRISQHTFVVEGEIEIDLTISAGVVSSSDQVHDFDDLVKKADALLYEAKQAGRNRIHYCQNC